MNKTKWVYIGSGSIAAKTADSIEKGKHEIVAVYSRNFEKAQKFAKSHGAVAYETSRDAILHSGADAVYIATPHTSHKQYALEALNLKMPVLCEKPVGVTHGDARELIECAKNNGTYFAEAMWTWFSDVALTVKQWVQGGEIGDLVSASIYFQFPGLMKPKDSRVRLPETAGGALLDVGIYPITYCYNLFGYPDKIECVGEIADGIDVSEDIILTYGSAKCDLHSAMKGIREDCTVVGTKGAIKLPAFFHMSKKAVLYDENGKKKKVFRGKTDYLTEFTRAAEEMKNGLKESEYIPFSATLDCMKIMDECRRQLNLVYPFEK